MIEEERMRLRFILDHERGMMQSMMRQVQEENMRLRMQLMEEREGKYSTPPDKPVEESRKPKEQVSTRRLAVKGAKKEEGREGPKDEEEDGRECQQDLKDQGQGSRKDESQGSMRSDGREAQESVHQDPQDGQKRRLIRLGRAKRVQKTRRMRRVLQESLKPKMMRKGIETVVPREAETRPSK